MAGLRPGTSPPPVRIAIVPFPMHETWSSAVGMVSGLGCVWRPLLEPLHERSGCEKENSGLHGLLRQRDRLRRGGGWGRVLGGGAPRPRPPKHARGRPPRTCDFLPPPLLPRSALHYTRRDEDVGGKTNEV